MSSSIFRIEVNKSSLSLLTNVSKEISENGSCHSLDDDVVVIDQQLDKMNCHYGNTRNVNHTHIFPDVLVFHATDYNQCFLIFLWNSRLSVYVSSDLQVNV